MRFAWESINTGAGFSHYLGIDYSNSKKYGFKD